MNLKYYTLFREENPGAEGNGWKQKVWQYGQFSPKQLRREVAKGWTVEEEGERIK